jgi:hypothetical protein
MLQIELTKIYLFYWKNKNECKYYEFTGLFNPTFILATEFL